MRTHRAFGAWPLAACAIFAIATARPLRAAEVRGVTEPSPAVTRRALRPRTGTVRTDTMWAQSLGVRKSLVVYLPPSYASAPARRFPVVIYLHGLGGNERNWTDAGGLATTLDSLIGAGQPEAIVVMPDGDDGWYTTWNVLLDVALCRSDPARKEPAASYCVPWTHYDDYIAHDVVRYVDRQYRTRATRASRGIAGLSMGGYGAITLALSYPQVFAAAASHSGVLSPRFLGPKPFAPPPRYATDTSGFRQSGGSLYKWLVAPFGRDSVGWVARDPGRMAGRLKGRVNRTMPALMFDCGVDDPYIDQNRDLHTTLTGLGIPHTYAEWPGKHDWPYWRAHSRESLTFLLGRVSR